MGFSLSDAWNYTKRAVAGVATGGLSELAGVYDKPATPDGNAYQWGGSPEAAAAARARYQGGTDQNLGQAAAGYSDLARGIGPSVAQEQLNQGLVRTQQAMNQVAANTRGGAAGALAATREAVQRGGDAALAVNGQAAQVRSAEQQAGLAGLGQIGSQYLGAETGMEQAQLGSQSAQDQARMGAEAAQKAGLQKFWSGLVETGGQIVAPKGK